MSKERIIPVLRKELLENSRMTIYGSGVRVIPLVKISFLIDAQNMFISLCKFRHRLMKASL